MATSKHLNATTVETTAATNPIKHFGAIVFACIGLF